MPQKRLSQTCLWLSTSLQQRCGSTVACSRVGTLNTKCTSPFEGGCHYLHYPYLSLASCQTTGREHGPAHQQKIGFKIYFTLAWKMPWKEECGRLQSMRSQKVWQDWATELKWSMTPPIRTRPSFSHSQSSPSGSFHKPLILTIRGKTEWKPQSQITNQTDHMNHSLI